MKKSVSIFSAALIVCLLLVGTACERHPASLTMVGYEEQQAEQQKSLEDQKLLPSANAPHFFNQATSVAK